MTRHSTGGIREPTHFEAAPGERLLEKGRVALDIRRLVGDVRDREQIEELRPIVLRLARHFRAHRAGVRGAGDSEHRQQQDGAH